MHKFITQFPTMWKAFARAYILIFLVVISIVGWTPIAFVTQGFNVNNLRTLGACAVASLFFTAFKWADKDFNLYGVGSPDPDALDFDITDVVDLE